MKTVQQFYKGSIISNHKVLFLVLISFLFISCSSSKDVISWNVELHEAEIPITDKCDPNVKLQSIKSAEKPKYLPATETRIARVRVLGIPCEEGEKAPIYEIPINRVKRITYVADPLSPPVQAKVKDLPTIVGCCRVRDGVLFFDKLEIKGFLGYRGSQDQVIYPTATGDEIYKSSFFGFDRGGSSMILGFEMSGLWNLTSIDKSNSFQLGFLTGAWPMDESVFVPLGIYSRYTFNQNPSKYSENCNSWFVYGTFGLPLDFQTEAPLFGKSIDYQRLFYGLGIGYDWALTCNLDFSLDLGFRRMNLPLPAYTCCPDIPVENKNPFRNSTALLLRFGLAF